MEQLHDGLYDTMQGKLFKSNLDYTCIENQFKVESIDLRPVTIQSGDIIEVYLLTEEYSLTDTWDGPNSSKSDINIMNQIIRLT